jgi:hypothetical protein
MKQYSILLTVILMFAVSAVVPANAGFRPSCIATFPLLLGVGY